MSSAGSTPPSHVSRRSQLAEEFRPNRLFPALIAGLIVGLIEVIFAVSFSTLLLPGEAAHMISRAVGLALLGATLSGIVIALFATLRGTIGGNQDVPAAILGVVIAAVLAAMPATATQGQTTATVFATIGLTTLATGAFMLMLGVFKLGSLIRFLPYPVVGGFLAGTGWLLAHGAIEAMLPEGRHIAELLHPQEFGLAAQLVPGVVLAVVLIVLSRRGSGPMLTTGVIIASAVLYHLVAAIVTGGNPQTIHGWLAGPFPDRSLLQPLTATELSQVNWKVILSETPAIVVIVLVSAISALLNATGLESASGQDVKLDQELRAAGVANLLTGWFAGIVNFQQFSLSDLNLKMRVDSRLPGLVAALVCAGVLFSGAGLLSLAPRFVIGGVLLYLGLELLIEWAIETYRKFPRIDYAIILLILGVIAVFGFFQGVAVGIAATVVMFVVAYSRVDVIRRRFTGEILNSRVTRPAQQRNFLSSVGAQMYILELHGFIFFGTANYLLEQVRARMEQQGTAALRHVLLDFHQVTGIDSTAALSFARMEEIAAQRGVTLFFTGASEPVLQQLQRTGIIAENRPTVRVYTDLDRAVEWCEEDLLRANQWAPTSTGGLAEQLAVLTNDQLAVDQLMRYLELLRLAGGDRLIRQGDPPDDMYFLESGQVTAQVEQPGHATHRLETMRGGPTVVGELGFYLGYERGASVVVDEPSVVYRLTRASLTRMEEEQPAAASALHRAVATLVADRTTHLIRVVNVLEA
ncbi:MAG: SLC26A/SulP transporter family protein [Anaerolineales bacterium]|nr:SLC26A/SulP transporter family protein [Anaerolineales bacterium]MCB9143339.1 SLC26A/SulP transporter family protein [Anaerolineales bacterium]MCO5243077.1 SulP family inorganic anion transporter [Anaerolineae bacterium]